MTREEFIAAIVADPNDRDLRLVFSDWLEENGEPELARVHRSIAKFEVFMAVPADVQQLVEDWRRATDESFRADIEAELSTAGYSIFVLDASPSTVPTDAEKVDEFEAPMYGRIARVGVFRD